MSSILEEPAYGTSISTSVFLITSDGKTLRLPIPSSSPKDPLNWHPVKRRMILGNVFFFAMLAVLQLQSLGVLVPVMAIDYLPQGISILAFTPMASSTLVFVGLSQFLWIPLSLAIGRRPVFLLANILLAVGSLYAAISPNFYHHIVAQSIQSIASGFTFSALGLMLLDLTFIHERIIVLSIFWSVGGAISNAVIAAVPKIDSVFHTWRGFYYVLFLLALLSSVAAYFLCPETYFHRPPLAFDGRVLVQSTAERVTIYETWAEAGLHKALPEAPVTLAKLRADELKILGLDIPNRWSRMRAIYPQILLLLLNPLVFWVMILNALATTGILAFDLSYGVLLLSPPYSFSIDKVALIKLACAAGSLATFPIVGLLNSKITRRLATRNGGRQSVEHYLPSFILPVITGFLAQLLYGLAAQRKLHYGWIFTSYGMMYFSFISLYTCNSLWAVEAFPCFAAASLAVVMGVSYILPFALSFVIKPWTARVGQLSMHATLGGMILGVGSIGIPIAICGREWRAAILRRYGNMQGGALRPQ
ncbi:major facilitator superfamily transporter [Rhexocercosporidium sp. MPI-PUGE-AT-0058]|nr:major facilitator superfamily transporter [Rhexocercosporidium sp. MPI-PUGE-AT-0058]